MTSPRTEQRRLRRRRGRIRLVIGATIVVVVVGFGAAGYTRLTESDSAGSRTAPTRITIAPPRSSGGARPTTTPPAPPTTTRPPPAPDGRTYAVGTHTETYVDPSRPTSPNGNFGGAPTRTLPTQFWYPAVSPGADAAPATKDGPYPLVLFSHGYNVTPDFYRPLLERWAAAGYVVAAPIEPILSGNDGGASHVDYVQTFTDASFVITKILSAPAGSSPIAGLADRYRIAATGHSDGEVIAFAVGFLDCCRDPRIGAVIAMAGDLSNANNPSARNTGTPILHIMETNDEYDPYPHSIAWDRDNLTPPRWMMTMENQSHVPPYTEPGDPGFELVAKATVAFLDGTLKEDKRRLYEMGALVAAAPGLATLEH